MKTMFPTFATRKRAHIAPPSVMACVLAAALGGAASAGAQVAQTTPTADTGAVAATLEQCVPSVAPGERSATFTGEMTEIPGAARMTMRIDLEERAPGETEFHPVTRSGLGVWRAADPKVKVYKYVKQVTNLSAPASYRGYVRFRWLSANRHVVKRAERLTARCLQPAPPAPPPPPASPAPAAPPPSSAPTVPGA